ERPGEERSHFLCLPSFQQRVLTLSSGAVNRSACLVVCHHEGIPGPADNRRGKAPAMDLLSDLPSLLAAGPAACEFSTALLANLPVGIYVWHLEDPGDPRSFRLVA